MYRWLKHDLAKYPNAKYPCTLAFWHHPLFSFSTATPPTPEVRPLWDLLYAARADVVLNANAHNYQRWQPMNPRGRRIASAGSASSSSERGARGRTDLAAGTWPSELAAAQDTTFGVLQMTLDHAGYVWTWMSAAGQPAYSDTVASPVGCA